MSDPIISKAGLLHWMYIFMSTDESIKNVYTQLYKIDSNVLCYLKQMLCKKKKKKKVHYIMKQNCSVYRVRV